MTILAQTILRSARDRLASEGGWTQGCFAKDEQGDFVYPTHASARCWCADGAIIAVQEAVGATPAVMGGHTPSFWITQAAKALGFGTASKLNDATGTRLDDVLAMFDLAIRLAESSEGAAS